jgi:DNA-binding CsgD family transcriptional regulator
MILDRVDERADLDRLLDAAKGGLSGALVLHGEAGMGKSTLLDYAAQVAPPLPLIRIAGVEAEQDFSFAALHRFLQPFLDRLDRLPSPQSDGLASAFGLASHSPAQPFLIGLATLTVLADVASAQGLLCIIDDSQWIDSESLHAIAFAARRLQADGIAILFGLRTSAELNLALAGLPMLEVSGLPEGAAYDLLSSVVSGPLDPSVARQVVDETSGCPLALTELADELTAEQWVGVDRVSAPIPIGQRLEVHFSDQVRALSSQAQTFVLIAAAETSGDASLVRKAALELGCERDSELDAVHARFLTTAPQVQFRHPLIRSAVYVGASAVDRKRVHRALASSIDRSTDPDRWAQHLAAITMGYDAQLASDLEAGANRARERGGFVAEASLLAQAAQFTEQTELRATRLLDATAAALNAAAPDRARTLLDQARLRTNDPHLLARAQQLEGRLYVTMLQPAGSPALFLAAARHFLTVDPGQARQLMLEAFDAFLSTHYFTVDTDGTELAELALATQQPGTSRDLKALLLDGTALLLAVGYVESASDLHEAARLMREGFVSSEDAIRWGSYGARIADELWDDRTYIAWVGHVESVSRSQGALFALRNSLISLSVHNVRVGKFSDAQAYFSDCLDMIRATGGMDGLMLDIYKPLNVELQAWRGDDAETRSSVKSLIEMGQMIGMATSQCLGYHALAILELSAGRYDEALRAAEFLTDHNAIGYRSLALPIVVEAGLRSGDRAAAERALNELAVRATASSTPWALGVLKRSQALMSDDSEAEQLYEQAICHLEQSLVVTELALAYLSYGEWLRRRKRRIDARVQLRKAHEAFATMGAANFAERARTELLATGEHVNRPAAEAGSDLTPQELKIAQLASRGETNPEIAAQMFISTSTVDYHLRKIYRKLGITSRRQLMTFHRLVEE